MAENNRDDEAFKAHKSKFNEVLNGLEIVYYPQIKKWQQYTPTIYNKNKLTRIYYKNIITPGNKTIIIYNYIYFYTDRILNVQQYK